MAGVLMRGLLLAPVRVRRRIRLEWRAVKHPELRVYGHNDQNDRQKTLDGRKALKIILSVLGLPLGS